MIHSQSRLKGKDRFLPVRPYGLYVKVTSEEVKRDEALDAMGVKQVTPAEIHYKGVVEGYVACGVWKSSPIEFSLPMMEKDGFFRIGSTLYVMTNVGFPSPWHPHKYGRFSYLNKDEVLLRILENMFGTKDYCIPGEDTSNARTGVFSSFFFGSTTKITSYVNNEKLQTLLLSRLVTHPFVRQVQPTPVQIEGSRNLVTLFPRRDGINIEPFIYNVEEMRGRLDPCSTSVSDTINCVYQLAEGAVIKNGRIEKGTSDYCAFTRRNNTLIRYSPKRAYLARAAVMNSAELTTPERRFVEARGGVVHTRNLLTAIMDLGADTYEDMIAMSATCAQGMEAQIVTRVTRWSPTPFDNLQVQIGDVVAPSSILALRPVDNVLEPDLTEEYEGEKGIEVDEEKKVIAISAVELREMGVLEGIEVTPSWHSSTKGVRTTWIFRSFIPMRTGNKITCFGGCKGVVRVLPDEKMPKTQDGRVIDICVSPYSVGKRGTLSMILEMSVGRAVKSGKIDYIEAYADEKPFDFRWAAMEEGSKEFLTYEGKKLEEPTYVGHMAWMAILKSGIASRRMSSVGTDRPLTGEGLLPDLARSAGQSLDPSKSIVLASREMYASLRAILGEGPGLEAMANTVLCVDGPAQEYEKNKT